MFRRLSNSLPKDPKIPADLTALGYFLNDDDQIRQIKNPDQRYQYQVNRNERVNEMHKEAMNTCIRTLVLDRLKKLDLETITIPLNTPRTPTTPHTQILASAFVGQCSRITVLFGERNHDLGIFAYRVIGNESISSGSAISLVNAINQIPSPNGPRGIIITNPGQLLWHRGEGQAITYSEWMSLPRKSAVHDALAMDPERCTIEGNRDYREHVRYIFEHVLRELVAKDAKLELIGLESTGHAMLEYLAENWQEWSPRIAGICLGSPQHSIHDLAPKSPAFADFISKRCRAYIVSDSEPETFLTGREEHGCNCYASGEQLYQENVIVAGWRSMLDWFMRIENDPEYEEVEVVVREGREEEETGWAGVRVPMEE